MDKGEKKSSTYSLLKDLDETVQKDKKKDYRDSKSANGFKKKRANSPKRSSPKRKGNYRKPKIIEIEEEELDYDIPDRSFGDLYCKACDSHMNSEQMWDAHIRGKRHLKQIKKGEPDLKYEDLDEDPIILPEIKNVKEPIVGLQHCCEIQRTEGKPTYQCFLCSASIATSQLLIEHVIGLKHRMAYLKEYDLDGYNLIMKADLKKGMIEPVVEEYVQRHENKRGSGKMHVKIEKPKPKDTWLPANQDKKASSSTFSNRKRPHQDDLFQKTKSSGNVSDRARDYPRSCSSRDDFSETSPGNSWQHDRYEKHESFFARRSLSPPHRAEMKFLRSQTDLRTVDTNTSWGRLDQASQFNVLERTRVMDIIQKNTESASNPSDSLRSFLKTLGNWPPRALLEIVLYIVNFMDSVEETDIDLLQKIGKRTFELFPNNKGPSSDLLNKSQERATSQGPNQGQRHFHENISEQNNVNMSAIQNLLDLFYPKTDKSTISASQNVPAQSLYNSLYEPAYTTQSSSEISYNLWGGASKSKDSTVIPGLTLSGTQESSSSSYLQNPSEERYTATHLWSPNQHKDSFNRF